MFGIGVPELSIILIIVIILFGAKRIPQIGKDLGKGLKEMRKVGKELRPEWKDDDDETRPS